MCCLSIECCLYVVKKIIMASRIKDKIVPSLSKRKTSYGYSWSVVGRVKNGKPITYTIGNVEFYTPSKARAEAKKALALMSSGINPNDERKRQERLRQVAAFTLGDALKEYSDTVDWKTKTRLDVNSTFQRRFSDWLNKPLASITKADVLRRFNQIKKDVARVKKARDSYREKHGLKIKTYENETGLAEAQRAFRYLSAVFNLFTEDDIDGTLILPHGNPCNYLKKKRVRKTLKPRERYLDGFQRSQLYSCLAAANELDYSEVIKQDDAELILMLIYTGLRLDEALSLKWADVDFENAEFTAYNTKNHKDHTLPMTEATKDLLVRRHNLHGTKKYVFPSPVDKRRHMTGSRIFARVSNETGFDFTAHDLRRTLATVASELNYDINSIGLVLNHSSNNITSRYIQGDPVRLREILTDIQNTLFPQAYS